MPITHGIDPNVETTKENRLSVSINRTAVFAGLTGGGPTKFDGIDGANIVAGTVFRAVVGTDVSDYLAVAGSHAESSPDFINPDSGASFYWVLLSNHASGSGLGDVVGPATATDGAFTLFDGTTGELIKDSTSVPGTGILAALAVNVGSAGAPVLFNGAGGTPSSLVLTNATGTPAAITLTNGAGLPGSGLASGIIPAGVTLTFGEGTDLRLDAALADQKWCGITEAGTAGATLAFGDLCYLAAADSRWELTDADAAATAGPVKLGICVLAAAADADPTVMLLWGKVRADSKFPALTISVPVHVSTDPGAIVVTAPSGTDDVIRIIGFGNTADEFFFCPSNDYITHT